MRFKSVGGAVIAMLAWVACDQSEARLAEKENKAQLTYQQEQRNLEWQEQQKHAELHQEFEQQRATNTEKFIEQHAKLENARAHAALKDTNRVAEARVDDATARTQILASSTARLQKLDARFAVAEGRARHLTGTTLASCQEDLALIHTQRDTVSGTLSLIRSPQVTLPVASRDADQKLDELEKRIGQLERHLDTDTRVISAK